MVELIHWGRIIFCLCSRGSTLSLIFAYFSHTDHPSNDRITFTCYGYRGNYRIDIESHTGLFRPLWCWRLVRNTGRNDPFCYSTFFSLLFYFCIIIFLLFIEWLSIDQDLRIKKYTNYFSFPGFICRCFCYYHSKKAIFYFGRYH